METCAAKKFNKKFKERNGGENNAKRKKKKKKKRIYFRIKDNEEEILYKNKYFTNKENFTEYYLQLKKAIEKLSEEINLKKNTICDSKSF